MAKTASAWRRPAAASLGGERAGLTHRLAPPGRCGSGGPAVRTSQADVETVPGHGRTAVLPATFNHTHPGQRPLPRALKAALQAKDEDESGSDKSKLGLDL